MTIIRRHVTNAGTNDAFTCLLPGESSTGSDSFDLYEDVIPGSKYLHCLDIGAPSTLDGIVLNTVSDISSSTSYNGSTLFGAANCDEASTVGWTNMSRVGDGTISAYDVAVLLWAQFTRPPYDQLPQNRVQEWREVETVAASLQIADLCCAHKNMSGWACVNTTSYDQQEYRVLQGADSCAHVHDYTSGYADPFINPGRRASESHASKTRKLSDEMVGHREHFAKISALRWAMVPGVGSWIKLELPVLAIAMEIGLLNVDIQLAFTDIGVKAPPAAGTCDAKPGSAEFAACLPDSSVANKIVISFYRRMDVIDAAGTNAEDCADINTADDKIMENGLLTLYQEPPTSACPFDVYIWVPDGISSFDHNAPCDGMLGVDVGSTINDGRGGFVQSFIDCASDLSPPNPPAEPSSPSPSGQKYKDDEQAFSIFFEVVIAGSTFLEWEMELYRIKLAWTVNVPLASVSVDVVSTGRNLNSAPLVLDGSDVSLRVAATITVLGQARAEAISQHLEGLGATEVAAIIGKLVLGPPVVRTVRQFSSPPPTPSNLGSATSGMTGTGTQDMEATLMLLILPALVLILLLVTFVACLRWRHRRRVVKVQPDLPSTFDFGGTPIPAIAPVKISSQRSSNKVQPNIPLRFDFAPAPLSSISSSEPRKKHSSKSAKVAPLPTIFAPIWDGEHRSAPKPPSSQPLFRHASLKD